MKGLVLSLLVTSILQQVLGAVAGERPSKIIRQVPAMYVLGDSTLDVGNNNFLPGEDVPRVNMPYYGVDFPGSIPTGRFTNGYNVADFIAKRLGFEKCPPPYLSLTARNHLIPSALRRGVSYASGGAGILDSTNAGGNIPLSKQVRYLESTKAEMVAKVGAGVVRDLLARSFFLIGVGSNDINAFAQAQHRPPSRSEVAAFYSSLISNYSATITDLYKMGARKFGIINVGPIGCVPAVRVLNAAGACNDGFNQLVAGFNGALRSLLASLAPKLPGLVYSLADSYNFTEVTLANPQASGFANIDSACCGSGRLGAESDCMPNSTLCANRDQFVFFDGVHASQRSDKLSAAAYYDGPAQFTVPINFKQLAMHKTS